MSQEAGYNYLNTAYTGISSAYLSGTEIPIYDISKIISLNDNGIAMSTSDGELI